MDLPKTKQGAAYAYSLKDIIIPPFKQGVLTIAIKMSGNIVLTTRNHCPVTFNLNKGEVDAQFVQQANFAVGSLISDMDLTLDTKTRNLTLKCMLVTRSRGPNTWATAAGVVIDSSDLKPKVRYELRAPELRGDLPPSHFFVATDVKIVVDMSWDNNPSKSEELRPQQPTDAVIANPISSDTWEPVFSNLAVVLAGVFLGAEIVAYRISSMAIFLYGIAVGDLMPRSNNDLMTENNAVDFARRGIRGSDAFRLPKSATPAMFSMNIKLTVTKSSIG